MVNLELSLTFPSLNFSVSNYNWGLLLQQVYFCLYKQLDTSVVVIDRMSRKLADYEEIEFLHMDVAFLDFPEACFDCVIDKVLF